LPPATATERRLDLLTRMLPPLGVRIRIIPNKRHRLTVMLQPVYQIPERIASGFVDCAAVPLSLQYVDEPLLDEKIQQRKIPPRESSEIIRRAVKRIPQAVIHLVASMPAAQLNQEHYRPLDIEAIVDGLLKLLTADLVGRSGSADPAYIAR
jgi:hypothetical protein